jgi:hypothetical protein
MSEIPATQSESSYGLLPPEQSYGGKDARAQGPDGIGQTKTVLSPEPQGVVPTKSNDPDDHLSVTKVVK